MNKTTLSTQTAHIVFVTAPTQSQVNDYLKRIEGCVLSVSDTASISPCKRMIAIATFNKDKLIDALLDEGCDRQEIH